MILEVTILESISRSSVIQLPMYFILWTFSIVSPHTVILHRVFVVLSMSLVFLLFITTPMLSPSLILHLLIFIYFLQNLPVSSWLRFGVDFWVIRLVCTGSSLFFLLIFLIFDSTLMLYVLFLSVVSLFARYCLGSGPIF